MTANSTGPSILRNQTLQQLVGYAELVKASGVSRSTIERAWRGPWDESEPRLPPPGKIGSRAVWLKEVADAWLVARLPHQVAMLDNMARSDPEDLSPEELEIEAVGLVVKAMEKRVGKPVDADGMGIHVTRKISADEFEEAERVVFAQYSERFANFDRQRALVMAAWLFQSLRPFIEKSVPAVNKPMHSTGEMLEFFGANALQDYSWEQLTAQYNERIHSAE